MKNLLYQLIHNLFDCFSISFPLGSTSSPALVVSPPASTEGITHLRISPADRYQGLSAFNFRLDIVYTTFSTVHLPIYLPF